MDDNTIKLNSTKIYEKVFTPNVKGYDPDEVDNFLDEIITDYISFQKFYSEANDYIKSLEEQLRKEKIKNQNLTMDNARLNTRLEGIQDTSGVNMENIDLLQRITKLENEVYKLGGDPTKL